MTERAKHNAEGFTSNNELFNFRFIMSNENDKIEIKSERGRAQE